MHRRIVKYERKRRSRSTIRAARATSVGRNGCGAKARAQIDLLTEVERIAQSDFYSYRYFATEGFLPGYSFPTATVVRFHSRSATAAGRQFLVTAALPRYLRIWPGCLHLP